MCELLGRIREMLMWQFLHAFSTHSAVRHLLTASAGRAAARGSFRDVFLIRHADVAVEVPVRVYRTSPDLVVDTASFPGSVYVCLLW